MSSKLLSCLIAVALSGAVHAATVNPNSGGTFFFQWTGGLGSIDFISEVADSQWTINAPVDSFITVSAYDDFTAGDEFGLVVDGLQTPWTSEGLTGNYFIGTYTNLFLAAGLHIFSLDVTTLAPGFTSGGAWASFSALTPAQSQVPEVDSFALMLGSALAGMAIARRRRQHA